MPRFVFFLVVGSFIGFGLASCVAKPICTSSAQCQAKESCLPSGLCAPTCTGAAGECKATEKCSPSGGCVDSNGGCGVDADCAAGQTCESGGTCATSSGTGGGSGSTGGGTAGTGGSGGSGGSGGAGGGQCGEAFTSTGVGANLMIVLDTSGSMDEEVHGVKKWDAARDAVIKMTTQNPNIHFGLEMFSIKDLQCSAGERFVDIGANKAAAIREALPEVAEGDYTQIAGGLTEGAKDPALVDTTRANGIVLITDGKQNCTGDRPTTGSKVPDDPVAVVEGLFGRPVSVRTWVVGFGGSVDGTMLANMAIKGGTARSAVPRYYQANVQADLQAALTAISNAAQGCSFKLTQAVPDQAKLFIAINGVLVPFDANRTTGWYYDTTNTTVTLYGPACDELANTPGAQLTVQYGCSDGLVESGGDGGFDFGLDAGEIG
jgi:hypothetical protein